MAVRWLLVLMTLIGAIPVRICTCGAHDHVQVEDSTGTTPAPFPPSEYPIANDSTPTEEHDPDCHYVKPRPLMPPGPPLVYVDIPPLDALGVALAERPQPEAAAGERTREFHPPPNRPLFLTLLVLRN